MYNLLTRHKKYILSIILFRLILAIYPPSYIHPDEFFQSQEVTAGFIFKTNVYIPWEFQSIDPTKPPSRTIVTPGITSGLSFLALSLLSKLFQAPSFTSGTMLLYTPRIFMIMITIFVDLIILSIATSNYSNISSTASTSTSRHARTTIIKYLLATSWVATSFFPRPFSNTCELLAFACSFGCLLRFQPGKQRSIVLGAVLAAGVFTRFTFIVFFLPLGIALLLQHDALHLRELDRRTKDRGLTIPISNESNISTNNINVARLKSTMYVLINGAIGAFTTSCLFVAIDSLYFGQFTISPLNNALYNMNTSNLAEHGLHPRWLHSVVNMQLLFGPLGLMTYGIVVLKIRSLILTNRNTTNNNNNNNNNNSNGTTQISLVDQQTCVINVDSLCLWCIVSGLGFLSLAPHQEARFLIPLLIPIVLVCASFLHQNSTMLETKKIYRFIFVIILVFNILLLLLFGIFHQGGLLRSLLYLEKLKITTATTHSYEAYYYKTHMPPRFILSNRGSPGDVGYCNIIDLKSGNIDELKKRLQEKTVLTNEMITLVIAPGSVRLKEDPILNRCLHLTKTFWPHLSTEDWPQSVSELELQIYEQRSLCV